MLRSPVPRPKPLRVQVFATLAIGVLFGMAVPQFALPGYGLFHLGYDPE